MNNNELDFINNILNGDNGYIEADEITHKTTQDIHDKREEALFYIFEKYIDIEQNQCNLEYYLETMTEYEYIEDYDNLNYGDFIRYPLLDDLTDIRMHTGGYIAKLDPHNKYGEVLPHLFLLKSPRAKENKFGIKKQMYWSIQKDSIIFRKLTQDDKLKASIAELLDDLLD
jgi:hypothetical protein